MEGDVGCYYRFGLHFGAAGINQHISNQKDTVRNRVLSLSVNYFTLAKSPKVFARLFQKAVGWRGKAPPCGSQTAKFLCLNGAGGAKNSPPDCFSEGNPRRGFPIDLRLLCILPDDIYFFYMLRTRCATVSFFVSKNARCARCKRMPCLPVRTFCA